MSTPGSGEILGRASALTALVSLAGTLGCTTTVSSSACPFGSSDEPSGTSSERHYGCATVYRTRGSGVVVGRAHIALGWMNETVVALPEPSACQVVIFVERAVDLVPVVQILNSSNSNLNNLCVAQGENK